MDNTSLGDRMKDYEKRFTDISLVPRIPCIIRLDGRSFHSYTRMFKTTTVEPPFSQDMKDAMVYAIKKTCNDGVSGIRAVYQQSDEITFYFHDEDPRSQGWFDYNVQKMDSVLCSIFTAHFNNFILNICHNRASYNTVATFDARAFNLPNEIEVNNCFLWRQLDFYRNSINMVGRAHFSHKQMNNLNTDQVQDLLYRERGINWNNLDAWKKRGVLVIKKTIIKDVEFLNKKTGKMETQKGVRRHEWTEVECPIFSQVPLFQLLRDTEKD
jgi:tRNA(His) guanylyltransferase